jgi:signal peptidase I
MLIVVPFRIYIAQPYIVSGSSMDPTFKDGDYLIVDQLSKRFSLPERNSVLIIKYPLNTKKFFIKRLIAFPNEQVSIKDGVVTVINEQNPEGVVIDSSFVAFEKKDNFYLELGENEFFVMGDNRAGSSDSRIWGPLPKENIVGKPILRLLPVNNISINPGLIYTK